MISITKSSTISTIIQPSTTNIIINHLPQFLSIDLPIPVPIKQGESFFQALHVLGGDVSVRAGEVCHGSHIN